jgi:hypothetical protein
VKTSLDAPFWSATSASIDTDFRSQIGPAAEDADGVELAPADADTDELGLGDAAGAPANMPVTKPIRPLSNDQTTATIATTKTKATVRRTAKLGFLAFEAGRSFLGAAI